MQPIKKESQKFLQCFRKFKELMRLPHYQAVGLITCFRYLSAPYGARLTPERIALATEWDGSPDQLYDALIESGLLIVAPERNN